MNLRKLLIIMGVTTLGLGSGYSASLRVYIGTYTGGESKGIYTCEMSTSDGSIKDLTLAAEVKSPSFLAIHPNKKFVYAVNEVSTFEGKRSGAVTAFKVEGKQLTKINEQSSVGDGPCYITVDKAGKNVLIANYGGGSVAVLPIKPDGSLSPHSSFVQHSGSSVDSNRQKGPHGHSINLDKANRFAIAADLGLDQLIVYKFDAEKGMLAPNDPPFVTVPARSGPRHFAFHPDGKLAFANGEMTSTIIGLAYDADKGAFNVTQTLSTLPSDWTGNNSTAEIQVHPNGNFVYVSNRGHNSIAVFEITKSGKLNYIENESTGGKTPRNFGIEPGGKFLVAANQDSDSLVVLKIDEKTGALSPTGHQLKAPKPVCVKFVAP